MITLRSCRVKTISKQISDNELFRVPLNSIDQPHTFGLLFDKLTSRRWFILANDWITEVLEAFFIGKIVAATKAERNNLLKNDRYRWRWTIRFLWFYFGAVLRKHLFTGDVKSRLFRSNGFSNFLNHISRIIRLLADYLVFPPSFCRTEAWPIRSYVYFCTYLPTLSGFHFAHVCIISSIGILVGGNDLSILTSQAKLLIFYLSSPWALLWT